MSSDADRAASRAAEVLAALAVLEPPLQPTAKQPDLTRGPSISDPGSILSAEGVLSRGSSARTAAPGAAGSSRPGSGSDPTHDAALGVLGLLPTNSADAATRAGADLQSAAQAGQPLRRRLSEPIPATLASAPTTQLHRPQALTAPPTQPTQPPGTTNASMANAPLSNTAGITPQLSSPPVAAQPPPPPPAAPQPLQAAAAPAGPAATAPLEQRLAALRELLGANGSYTPEEAGASVACGDALEAVTEVLTAGTGGVALEAVIEALLNLLHLATHPSTGVAPLLPWGRDRAHDVQYCSEVASCAHLDANARVMALHLIAKMAHLLPLQYEVSLLHHQAVKRALSSALAATQPLCVQLAGVCVAAISPLAVMEELDVSFASASQRLAATQTCTTGVSTWQNDVTCKGSLTVLSMPGASVNTSAKLLLKTSGMLPLLQLTSATDGAHGPTQQAGSSTPMPAYATPHQMTLLSALPVAIPATQYAAPLASLSAQLGSTSQEPMAPPRPAQQAARTSETGAVAVSAARREIDVPAPSPHAPTRDSTNAFAQPVLPALPVDTAQAPHTADTTQAATMRRPLPSSTGATTKQSFPAPHILVPTPLHAVGPASPPAAPPAAGAADAAVEQVHILAPPIRAGESAAVPVPRARRDSQSPARLPPGILPGATLSAAAAALLAGHPGYSALQRPNGARMGPAHAGQLVCPSTSPRQQLLSSNAPEPDPALQLTSQPQLPDQHPQANTVIPPQQETLPDPSTQHNLQSIPNPTVAAVPGRMSESGTQGQGVGMQGQGSHVGVGIRAEQQGGTQQGPGLTEQSGGSTHMAHAQGVGATHMLVDVPPNSPGMSSSAWLASFSFSPHRSTTALHPAQQPFPPQQMHRQAPIVPVPPATDPSLQVMGIWSPQAGRYEDGSVPLRYMSGGQMGRVGQPSQGTEGLRAAREATVPPPDGEVAVLLKEAMQKPLKPASTDSHLTGYAPHAQGGAEPHGPRSAPVSIMGASRGAPLLVSAVQDGMALPEPLASLMPQLATAQFGGTMPVDPLRGVSVRLGGVRAVAQGVYGMGGVAPPLAVSPVRHEAGMSLGLRDASVQDRLRAPQPQLLTRAPLNTWLGGSLTEEQATTQLSPSQAAADVDALAQVQTVVPLAGLGSSAAEPLQPAVQGHPAQAPAAEQLKPAPGTVSTDTRSALEGAPQQPASPFNPLLSLAELALTAAECGDLPEPTPEPPQPQATTPAQPTRSGPYESPADVQGMHATGATAAAGVAMPQPPAWPGEVMQASVQVSEGPVQGVAQPDQGQGREARICEQGVAGLPPAHHAAGPYVPPAMQAMQAAGYEIDLHQLQLLQQHQGQQPVFYLSGPSTWPYVAPASTHPLAMPPPGMAYTTMPTTQSITYYPAAAPVSHGGQPQPAAAAGPEAQVPIMSYPAYLSASLFGMGVMSASHTGPHAIMPQGGFETGSVVVHNAPQQPALPTVPVPPVEHGQLSFFVPYPDQGLSMQQAQPQQQQQQQRVVGHKVSSGGWELPVKRPRGRQSDDVASAGPSSHPYHAAWASGPGHNPDA